MAGWARAVRRLHDQSGMTLPEIMVVIAVLGVVMLYALQSVASFERATTGEILRLENLEEARVLMQVVSKDVRTAVRLSSTSSPFPDVLPSDGFTRADDRELMFYANLDLTSSCPKIVWIHVDSNYKLLEEVWDPTGGTPPSCTYPAGWNANPPTGATRIRLVGRYVANPTGEPIFTYYYDNAGTLTAYSPTVTPLSSATSFLVTSVQIQLSIRKDTSSWVNRTTLINRVRLPNIYYHPEESPSP
jgi:prepilin-type N-terminal cleavage/methylation domain-containing protein